MRAAWYEKQGPAREVLEIFRRYGAVAICMDPRSRISQASGVRNYAPAASRAQRRSSPASSRHPTGPKKNSTGPSSHDLVSDATVHSGADLLFGGKVIWESGIDLARLVECLYLFRRESKVEARKIILQLRKLSCRDYGDNRLPGGSGAMPARLAPCRGRSDPIREYSALVLTVSAPLIRRPSAGSSTNCSHGPQRQSSGALSNLLSIGAP